MLFNSVDSQASVGGVNMVLSCVRQLWLMAVRVASCRVISDDKESSSGKDDRGKLKTVKRKVVQLFGMADKEEENQAADFEDDDALDALEQEEEERAEAQEQGKEGDDGDLEKEKLLYWEVRLRRAARPALCLDVLASIWVLELPPSAGAQMT